MNLLTITRLIGQILSPRAPAPDGLTRFPEQTWESLVSISSQHLVTPAFYPALVAKGAFAPLPGDLKQYLSYIHELNVDRNTALMDQATDLARVLNEIGITPVMLKGMAYLFSDLHGDIGARVVGDIDCFVPEDKIEKALDRLQAIGYAFLWDKGPEPHHHVPPLSKEGFPAVVELHTHPIKRDFAALLSVEDFIAGVTTLAYEGAKIGIPSPTHQALICIEHEGLANRDDDFLRVSLRGLHDLARLLVGPPIDWQELTHRFARAHLSRTLRRYLTITRYFFLTQPDTISVSRHLPPLLHMALRFPRIRPGVTSLSLGTRCITDKRIRAAALRYGLNLARGKASLFSLKRHIADGK